jgi:hypothetical protein
MSNFTNDTTTGIPLATTPGDLTGEAALALEARATILNTHIKNQAGAHGGTASNTAGKIVQRDGSGNFAAGTITAGAVSTGGLQLAFLGTPNSALLDSSYDGGYCTVHLWNEIDAGRVFDRSIALYRTGNVGIGDTSDSGNKLNVVGTINATGGVTAASFTGDGSGLTGLPGGTPPSLADVLATSNDATDQDIANVGTLTAAALTFTDTYGAGINKIDLFNGTNQYGLGVDASTLNYHSDGAHVWNSGGSVEMSLSADGVLSVPGSITLAGTDLARTISTTAPLTGGGDLSANRTLAISDASGSAAGSMSAAHYSLVNNATSSNFGGTLVKRTGDGSFAGHDIISDSHVQTPAVQHPTGYFVIDSSGANVADTKIDPSFTYDQRALITTCGQTQGTDSPFYLYNYSLMGAATGWVEATVTAYNLATNNYFYSHFRWMLVYNGSTFVTTQAQESLTWDNTGEFASNSILFEIGTSGATWSLNLNNPNLQTLDVSWTVEHKFGYPNSIPSGGGY